MTRTGLKRSQIRTLRDVAGQQDGRIDNLLLAEVQHSPDPAACAFKLERLAKSGHLREVRGARGIPGYELADLGAKALEEVSRRAPRLRRSQLETLLAVADHPGGYISTEELAELEGIKKGAAERRLSTLVAGGRLRRSRGPHAGRLYILTRSGREALEGARTERGR